MSAFLLFSQGRRGKVKENHPGMKNTEVSRVLGEQWRNLTEMERQPFLEEEKSLRETYKVALSEWKGKEGERKELELNRRTEQLECYMQHQQAVVYTQQHARQQQQNVAMHIQTHPYPQQVFMYPCNPPHAYPEYPRQAYPSAYGKTRMIFFKNLSHISSYQISEPCAFKLSIIHRDISIITLQLQNRTQRL
jgi:proteasome lid subunit RPN8/RPN11